MAHRGSLAVLQALVSGQVLEDAFGAGLRLGEMRAVSLDLGDRIEHAR